MNSSIVAGERRWASQRRGGMTVLGKVTAPKPINLPSQRLENHGLDPNVEIVPKGTVSWRSRSSSSGSNPWTSSSVSPKADGGTVSPSHLSGRPSSGGSGTRPSTSGSDKTQDPAPSAWGSNSRPSSASGTLSTNQTSPSLRPRSVENRPNSSQLSRFAEPVSKTSATWGSSATAERLGVKSLKEDNFSLISGDFPTLGSEKDNPVKSIESEDCRSSSASGVVQEKEDDIPDADIKHGTVNTWRAESSPHAEDDLHPNMEKWQGDPQRYFNPNAAPQRYEGWRGPPMNGPAGGWYGGRPRGPSFGPRVHPGGFPMEPFPYYRPQVPPPPLAGPPPGPRGPHPKNGDLYRPQMHESYPRPGMPFRPNFYPGPPGPIPFEGYYGPPMGYRNSEHDVPYMGMATGPPVYNGYPSPSPDLSNSHGRSPVRGPAGKTMSEQVEVGNSEDKYGPKRVPLNSHHEYEQEEGGRWEQNAPPNILHHGKNRYPVSTRRNEWGAEEDAEEAVPAKRMVPSENPPKSYGNRIHSADSSKVKSFEGTCSSKGVNDNWTNKSEGPPSFPPAVPADSERDALLPPTTNNSSLMHKIDGLNSKFRVSDGLNDSTAAYDRGNQRARSHNVDSKVNSSTGEGNTAVVGDNQLQPIAVSRKSYHGGHPRVDNRGKGKFNAQNADGWQRKPPNTDSSTIVVASINEPTPNIPDHDPNYIGEASENSIVDPAGKTEKDSVEVCDSADIQAQRAKMKEIAKQRALQLQKEEEERVREQKAKALAKLEELDRRRIAGEAANQKGERTLMIGDIRIDKQESHTPIGTVIAELKTNESGFNLVLSPAVTSVETDSSINHSGKSVEVSRILHPTIQQKGSSESNAPPMPKNGESGDGSAKNFVSQPDEGGISRNKRAGYKQKQSNPSQKSLNEKTVSSTAFEVQKDHTHAAVSDVHEPPPNDTNASNTVVEPPSQQRKRFNRSNKPKPKPDETPTAPASPPVTSDAAHYKGGSNNSEPSLVDTVSTVNEPDKSAQTTEVSSSLPNQWKAQPSRRMPKNQQAHRFADKHHGSDTFVWAPKVAKGTDDASQTSVPESANSAKGNNASQSSLKGKRAEMERYVPKPQLAQQGSATSLLSSVGSSRSNDGPTEKGVNTGPPSVSEPMNDIQQPKELVQTKAPGPNHSSTDTTTAAAANMHPPAKDQGGTGRGKRHQPRGPRSSGNNPHLENTPHGEAEVSSVQSNQVDKPIVSKENPSLGERTSSQWQRKSSPNPANNQQGNRNVESESAAPETNRIPRKDNPHHKEISNSTQNQPQIGQPNAKSNVDDDSVARRHQDFEKAKRPGRPYSPNQDPVGSTESFVNDQLEQNVTSGFRRPGRQNNRPLNRGEWSSGHDNRPGRQRQNVHLEYQPVGPFKSQKPAKPEEQTDEGGDGTNRRYRERGQHHFYRR